MNASLEPARDQVHDAGEPHLADAAAIIEAIRRGSGTNGAQPRALDPAQIGLSKPAAYQRHLCARFGEIIGAPSFDYLSKTPSSWLLVGDRRAEIATRIRLLIERHGLGVGMLVLHLQQIRAGHVLTSIMADGERLNLAVAPAVVKGAKGEAVLHVPLRQFRADFARLAAIGIAKPAALWNHEHIVTHERDAQPCAYCSCAEINPAEVVVDIEGARHGLSRNYSLGFTFAPFGNPLTTVHFLAWDRAATPLNMSRVPMTVSDLVKLTREINRSIRSFFAETGVRDFPSLDGLSNGWAGNSVFHQHFQFFVPETPLPILRARLAGRPLLRRDDVTVARMDWPSPAYRIRADESLNTGLVGNDMAGIWRLLGGSRLSPYKKFRDGYLPADGELVPSHTQNFYVPGSDLGVTTFLFLRDRDRVDYVPGSGEVLGSESGCRAQAKENLGALEVGGSIILDDKAGFDVMRQWSPEDVSRQVRQMIASVAPDADKVAEFESAVKELFPA